jgi:hypothetical protein
MYLVEILLPLFDKQGTRFPKSTFDQVRNDCTERFGGVTAFLRAPAVGLWKDSEGEIRRDDIAVFEVMADTLDREWWRDYRARLETAFNQDSIVTRALQIEAL